MQAHNYIFLGTGLAIMAIGLWSWWMVPRMRAKHEADVASRERITGHIVEYEFDSEDNSYQPLIEYEINGLAYRIRGADNVRERRELPAPVPIAYRRDKRSDAIEVAYDDAWEKVVAKGTIALGAGFALIGLLS